MRIVKGEGEEKLRAKLLQIIGEVFNYHDRDSFPEAVNLGMQEVFEKWADKLIQILNEYQTSKTQHKTSLRC